jgi:DNA-binding GntR family transcriptional regulator
VHTLHVLSDLLALLPGNHFEFPERARETTRQHLAVLIAVEQRQPENAEKLARQHIQNAGFARIHQVFES